MKMFDELRLVRALTDEQIAGDQRLVGTSRTRQRAGGFSRRPPGGHHRASRRRSRSAIPVSTASFPPRRSASQLEDLDRFAKEVIPAFRG
ncbi:MAG: hypothetical protein ACJ8AH_24500 [Stellaceae bacterium]